MSSVSHYSFLGSAAEQNHKIMSKCCKLPVAYNHALLKKAADILLIPRAIVSHVKLGVVVKRNMHAYKQQVVRATNRDRTNCTRSIKN